jgi:L1 cell adhesion molecule like protein
MTKREGSPPTLDEIKKEVDPIVEEGLKWFEENKSTDIEVYKSKQKEIEEKVNPLMQKLYSQGTPGGMPDFSGMASGMPEGMSGGMPGMPEEGEDDDDSEEIPTKNKPEDELD